ncbi:MAG TPA: hypothetical protein PLH31_02305 [Caulobacter sp.]|nr:hypothetical protein [Caulobacter sp.]
MVAPQYTALAAELAAIRHASDDPRALSRAHPVKGDPFRDFAGFATSTLNLETRLRLRQGVTAEAVERVRTIELDMFAANWRGTLEEALRVIQLLSNDAVLTVRELLTAFPTPRRRHVQMSLVWMAKQGFLDWL